jgi:hypothetical protein
MGMTAACNRSRYCLFAVLVIARFTEGKGHHQIGALTLSEVTEDLAKTNSCAAVQSDRLVSMKEGDEAQT